MRKWDLVLVTLLIACLGLNLFIWREVQEIKENQTGAARRDQVDRISLSVSEAVQTIEVFAKEQKWIRENSFLLDKDNSGTDTMVVEAQFTFNTMEQKQKPFFLLREKGSKEWVQLELEHRRLLDYAIALNLSPLVEYEYQLITHGDWKRSSDICIIPYNIYGAPRWKEEIKVISVNSDEVDFTIYVFMAKDWPVSGMEPKNVTLKIETNGKELHQLSLDKENTNSPEKWKTKLRISDLTVIDEIEAFIEVEYQNGLKKKDDIELFKQRVQYEINKNSPNKILVNL